MASEKSSWNGYNSWDRRYNSWDDNTEDDDGNILMYGLKATAAYVGWLLAKDMSWLMAEAVFDVMGKVNKRLLLEVEKRRASRTEEDQQQPTLADGLANRSTSSSGDPTASSRTSTILSIKDITDNIDSARTADSWDGFIKFVCAEPSSDQKLTLRLSTTYDSDNATFEATFPIDDLSGRHDDPEAFLRHVCQQIEATVAAAPDEYDRWMGPDRNIHEFLIKLLMNSVAGR